MQEVKSKISSKQSFLVCAAPYRNSSAGVICLHELCDALVKLEYESHLVIMGGDAPNFTFHASKDPAHFHPKLTRSGFTCDDLDKRINEIIHSGITIYPEVVVGNPLNSRRVVRYFLNRDGAVTGHRSNFTKKDFILTYADEYFQNPHYTLYKPITDEHFNDIDAPDWDRRPFNLTYIGKGSNYIKCSTINKTIEITRQWPQTKANLAFILRNSKYLFCWDNLTQLHADGVLCGAKPVLLQDIQSNRHNGLYGPFGKLPYLIGSVKNNEVELMEHDSYDADRRSFIVRYREKFDGWNGNVFQAVNTMLEFFIHSKNQRYP
ncbi:hypothetical protein [Polynucleobacter sp. MWH-UH35A]|uniref:hypothetical protein n=1 Tax=Polynucleobacter sp. MWH-UH35A TaxID=1855619 RepID=UPI001BFDA2A2|nr:hypothetical protein [Polynucleobacter sp. MWH-UH35A]QWD59745.1 hypothetical protein ICV36_08060 [Polynucleobacter sp. MWH-UH35A]